jgi:predicted nucleic acid-binding protein
VSPLTLVDSNVLLDILTEDPVWYESSADALADRAEQGRLAINPLIYAEVSGALRPD